MAQTKDGYLWIGTQSGLFRFDGVHFTPSAVASEEGYRDFEITALYGAPDGSLWVGGRHHLGHMTGDLYKSYGWKGFVTSFDRDPNGKIWFSRTRNPDSQGALCSVEGPNVRCFGKQQGLDCRYGNALVSDGAGGFWVGWDQLCHWNGTSTSVLPFSKLKNDVGTLVSTLLKRPDGTVMVGIDGAPTGKHPTETVTAIGNHVRVISDTDTLDPGTDIMSLINAQDGSLWVGTRQNGIYHVTSGRTDHYGSKDGLSGDHVNSMLQDSEGDLWVATTDGIDRLRLPKVLTVSSKEGLDVDNVSSLAPGTDGSMWIPTVDGLNLFKDDHVEQIQLHGAGGGRQVLSTFQDSSGKLWIATTTHLLTYSGGRLSTVRQTNGVPLLYPLRIIQDSLGAIWIQPIWKTGTATLYRIESGAARPIQLDGRLDTEETEADPKEGLWLRFIGSSDIYRYRGGTLTKAIKAPPDTEISYFLPDQDGSVWAVPLHGLMHWSDGRWKTLGMNSGLPCASLLELQFDHEGNLWLLARCGLIKIDRGEIRGWASGSVLMVHPQLFGASDGVRAMSTYYLPRSSVASDGRLWFGGDAGVQVVDPSSIRMNTIPPPVHIEKLVVDGAVYTAGARLRPLPHNVEIDYTALSLVSPSQVRFRYRLIGSEKQWQDAQARRQAFYQNLKPGSYRFELVACNNDGVWNQVGDAVTFSIPPAFYQTAWFRCVLLCLILVLGWIVIRLRELRAANEIEAKMSERLMERDRIARELHDTLLQGFQSIVFRFQTAWKMTPHDELANSVMTDTLARADAVLKDGRAKVRDLRGGEPGQALSNELREFIAWQVPPSGLVSSVNTIGEARPLNEVVREEVAAVAKEAIVNALMHSNATSLVCELNFDRNVFTVTCNDNGVGIPSGITSQGRSGHYGLLGMKERAERMGGSLRISAGKPSGTVVRLQIAGRLAYKREAVDTQAGLLNRLLARAAKRFR